MKKLILYVFAACVCLLVYACAALQQPSVSGSETQNESGRLPRIIAIQDKQEDYAIFLKEDLGNYTDLQSTMDTIVNRYNTDRNGDDLLTICFALRQKECFKDGNNLVIAYYSEFFNRAWADEAFNKKITEERQYYFAENLLTAFYQAGRISEGIPFTKKYVQTLKKPDDIVQFGLKISGYYSNVKEPRPGDIAELFFWVKYLEKEYYDQVTDLNKIKISSALYQCADKLGDTQSAQEYKEKAKAIYQKLVDAASAG